MSREINYFELRGKIAEVSGHLSAIAKHNNPIRAEEIQAASDELMALLKASSHDYCQNHFMLPTETVTP